MHYAIIQYDIRLNKNIFLLPTNLKNTLLSLKTLQFLNNKYTRQQIMKCKICFQKGRCNNFEL